MFLYLNYCTTRYDNALNDYIISVLILVPVQAMAVDRYASCCMHADTHVWQIATAYYLPKLRGKSLTPKVHGAVQDAFEERFGPFAGW